jgi:hypothetical protein
MKTILDPEIHNELLSRLANLTPEAAPQWGQMSPSQMMEHTARVLDMATGRKPMKQIFLGKALSWIFKKEFLGDKPFKPNRPTGPDFKIKEQPDFEATRIRLSELVAEFHNLGESGLDGNVHAFFGPLTGKQWGETQYKHLDHHLRQFGV